jgi:polysaccharide export outer membrane protein
MKPGSFNQHNSFSRRLLRRLDPSDMGQRYSLLLLRVLMFAGLLCFMDSCQSPPSSGAKSQGKKVAETLPNPSTTLREGDVIQIAFEISTNLNVIQKVSIDGMVAMPVVGKIKALGKSPQELESVLEALYEPKLRGGRERITVTVASATAIVYVTGAVLRPGKVPLDRPLTALDALVEAGGPEPSRAKLTEVVVLRTDKGRRLKFILNLKRALKGDDDSLFYLEPFDIIYVPEKAFNF